MRTDAHFHVIFSLDRSPLRVKKKFALNKIYTSNIHIYWPRRSALNYPYVKILVSLGLVRSGWCVGWCAGCSRQFCGARGGARDGAGGGRSAGNRGDLRRTAGSSKTPSCLAYIRAKTRGRIRFPADPCSSPRIPAVPRGSLRFSADSQPILYSIGF